MKNSAGQGGCYPQRLKAEVDNTSKICKILHIIQKNFTPIHKRTVVNTLSSGQ